MELLYEGKAKKLYRTNCPDEVLMEFKDDATAFNGKKKTQFQNKGAINKQLTCLLYRMLEERGIPSHFVRDVDEIRIIVRRVEIIPVEVVVRNWVAGSLAGRIGRPEGTPLSAPMVEFYYKKDELNDPLITTEHLRELNLATDGEVSVIRDMAMRINGFLGEFFEKVGIRLVDFKVEFGRLHSDRSRIILADEITPDTCRLWDIRTGRKLDKDRFRRDLGEVMESYSDVLGRVSHALSV